MKSGKKIIFFIVTTIILGSISFLIINNLNEDVIKDDTDDTTTIAIIEEIDYEKYMELRSKAYDTETYAILIWNSSEEISKNYLEEVKASFENRKSVVYTIDVSKISKEDFSRIIDDVTAIMKYKEPKIIVPTTIIMSKGEVIYSHAGLIFKEELIDNLNAKSIE